MLCSDESFHLLSSHFHIKPVHVIYVMFFCCKRHPLHKKCPYSELFLSAFSRIRTEYGDLQSKSPYSARMRENVDQKNPEYGHFTLWIKYVEVNSWLHAHSSDTFSSHITDSIYRNEKSIIIVWLMFLCLWVDCDYSEEQEWLIHLANQLKLSISRTFL